MTQVGPVAYDSHGMAANRPGRRFRAAYVIPVVLFLGLALALGWGLTRDPSELPSALIGKPVPEFSLPPVQGRKIGRAHVRTPVTHAHIVCRLLLEKQTSR